MWTIPATSERRRLMDEGRATSTARRRNGSSAPPDGPLAVSPMTARRGTLEALAAVGAVYLAHGRPRAVNRCACPPLRSGPLGDCPCPTVREALCGPAGRLARSSTPEVQHRGAAPMSRSTDTADATARTGPSTWTPNPRRTSTRRPAHRTHVDRPPHRAGAADHSRRSRIRHIEIDGMEIGQRHRESSDRRSTEQTKGNRETGHGRRSRSPTKIKTTSKSMKGNCGQERAVTACDRTPSPDHSLITPRNTPAPTKKPRIP